MSRRAITFDKLPERVQRIAIWVAKHFEEFGRWPTQADVARLCRRLGVDGADLRNTYSHDVFDGSLSFPPRSDVRVRVRSWVFFDLGLMGETFGKALTLYRRAVERVAVGPDDAVRIDASDVSPLRTPFRDLIGSIFVERLGGAAPANTPDGSWSVLVSLAELEREPATVDELLRRPEQWDATSAETAAVASDQSALSNPFSDRYRVGDKLGAGAFADVYKVEDLTLGRTVALKIIRASAPSSHGAIRHARVLARVSHPNVVSVFDVIEVTDPATQESVHGVVMELVDGPTLLARLRGDPFSAGELARVGHGLIDAIREYHTRGLAHLDLHSENVIVGSAYAKVLDPLFYDTAILGKTGMVDQQQERDVADLRFLLGRILRHSAVPLERIGEFERRTERRALDVLREEFVRVTSQSPDLDRDLAAASATTTVPERRSKAHPTKLVEFDYPERIGLSSRLLEGGHEPVWALKHEVAGRELEGWEVVVTEVDGVRTVLEAWSGEASDPHVLMRRPRGGG